MRAQSSKQKSKPQAKHKLNVNKEYGEGNYRASREYSGDGGIREIRPRG